MPLKIYLADLTHMDLGVATEAFPLNIGLIASYAKKIFGNEIDVTLFKYPQDLLEALREEPPHILGCSNYTWNCNLSYYFANQAKSLNPNTLIVWGGTNYPFQSEQQEKFLRKYPKVDIHIYYEGEVTFTNIVRRVLSDPIRQKVLQYPIDGCQFISPADNSFVKGEEVARIKDLNSIPSPYVTGLLDKFFDGTLTPMMETTRGCPFLCNFCNAGDTYYNIVGKFGYDYIEEEFSYIARQAKNANVAGSILADNNFGMMPRDSKIAQLFHDLKEKYNWPSTITTCTGKNSKARVIEATKLLGSALSVTMSVQSMNDDVLKNIKRDNIRLEDYHAITEELAREKRSRAAEVIAPLPGETLESFFKGVAALLDTKVRRVHCHTLTPIYGTVYKDDEKFIKEFEYKSKFRLVIRNFTTIEGHHIFDVEEAAISTKDMSFNEYTKMRQFMFVVELCSNCEIFEPLLHLLEQKNIKASEWVSEIWKNLHKLPESIKEVFESFNQETIDELWDSEEALIAHYSEPENYRQLIEGKRGNNVIFKHRIWLYSQMAETWVNTVFKISQKFILNSLGESAGNLVEELDALKIFIVGTASECYSPDTLDTTLTAKIKYNIPGWMDAADESLLENFAMSNPLTLKFSHSVENKCILADGFKRYGTDLSGMVKLIQRMAGRTPTRVISESCT
jgi:radical SAM superfamily enzyme YgiQ (UPF0313 family)